MLTEQHQAHCQEVALNKQHQLRTLDSSKLALAAWTMSIQRTDSLFQDHVERTYMAQCGSVLMSFPFNADAVPHAVYGYIVAS